MIKFKKKRINENKSQRKCYTYSYSGWSSLVMFYLHASIHKNICIVHTWKHVETFTLIKMTRQTLEILIQICWTRHFFILSSHTLTNSLTHSYIYECVSVCCAHIQSLCWFNIEPMNKLHQTCCHFPCVYKAQTDISTKI